MLACLEDVRLGTGGGELWSAISSASAPVRSVEEKELWLPPAPPEVAPPTATAPTGHEQIGSGCDVRSRF